MPMIKTNTNQDKHNSDLLLCAEFKSKLNTNSFDEVNLFYYIFTGAFICIPFDFKNIILIRKMFKMYTRHRYYIHVV